MAQAVIHQHLSVETWVFMTRSIHVGFVMDKVALEQIFLQVIRFYRQHQFTMAMLCLMSEDVFVIICVANFMEVKVSYVQQVLRYEISSYWRFNV
jgi:hypothetical protein